MSALLLQVAVKASVVFLATWIVTMTMRRQSAAARHLAWTLGISAALLLPVLGAATPAWDVSMPAAPPIVAVQTPADAPSTAAVDAPASDAASVALQPATRAPRAGNGGMTTPTILVSLWLCGVLVSLLKLAGGVWRLRSIASSASVVDSDEWVSEAVHAASALQLRTAVSLRMTARTVMPVVCGIWRPTILLPLTAAGWSLERRRVVLLHESAHVKRHDCATLTLARVAAALHWFNPLAYVALKQLRAEQERAADDLVLMAGTEASAYADHLLEIARAFRASAPIGATALAMARPSEIEGRLLAILEPSRSRRPLSRAVRSWATAAAAIALMPLAALHVSASAPASEVQVPTPRWTIAPLPLPVPAPLMNQAVPAPAPAPRVQTPAPATPPAPPAPPALSAPPAQTTRPDEATRRRIADALMGALDDSNQRVREQALDTLVSMRDERAVPALIKALGDPTAEVRERAATGLGNMRDSRAVAPLVEALRDSHANVRRRAASALGVIADPMAIDGLTAALKDADPTVREQAAESLGRIARGRSSASASFSQSFDVNVSMMKQDALREFEAHREDLKKLQEELNNWRLGPDPPTPPPAPAAPPR